MEQDKQQLEERYLDIHEAAGLLEVSEEEVWRLVRKHEIPYHNVAGAFVRFRKQDIEGLKIKWRIHRELFPAKEEYFPHKDTVQKATWMDQVKDFWYFNDYYILCFILMVMLLYFIISSQ